MSKREDYEKKTMELLEPIAAAAGVSIYDVEYVREGKEYYLRSYIDKEGGVTIDDCEKVSRALSDKLDEEDFIPDAYIMEVSSPGLGRALRKDRHFQSAVGESIDIKFYGPVEGSKEISGTLKSYDREHLVILHEGKEMELNRSDMASVNLTLDL